MHNIVIYLYAKAHQQIENKTSKMPFQYNSVKFKTNIEIGGSPNKNVGSVQFHF